MTNPKGKSNQTKYNEAKNSHEKKLQEWLDSKNKETAAAKKLADQCGILRIKMAELEPKLGIPLLSSVCKKKLIEIYITAKTGFEKDIVSKYLEKGLAVEEDSITLYSEYTGEFHKKNKVRLGNGWVNGECDEQSDIVRDYKSSWDIFTHFAKLTEPISKLNYWQMQCYLWLWNKQSGSVINTLINTPLFLVLQEEKKMLYENSWTNEDYQLACEELRAKHCYDHLPIEDRIIEFKVKRNDEAIDMIKARLTDCREYMNNISTRNLITSDEETEE